MKKLTITGTKGKTTVSTLLAQVLRVTGEVVLNVDTAGVYLNGKQVLTKSQSQTVWDVVPTVAPGRFLYLLNDPATLPVADDLNHSTVPGVAVLEASLGCGTVSGLGYYGHDVGIFTNVFEDHLGSRPDLNDKKDIALSKRFIFSRINREGYAVFNGDDENVCSQLSACKEGVTLIPFGVKHASFDLEAHRKSGGMAISVEDNTVVLYEGKKTTRLLKLSDVAWTFNGHFMPSVYNLMAIIGGLIGYSDGRVDERLIERVKKSRLDPMSGRLVLMKNSAGVKILADYAHEKQSLASVAKLARHLTGADGKVIGVLRLTWDRTEELIRETAEHIAGCYDEFVIYDKIDGYWRHPSERFRTSQRQFVQEVGKVSAWFADELTKQKGDAHVTRILREDEAVAHAATLAGPGDVVVVIVNDNIHRSIDFIKESFKADFI